MSSYSFSHQFYQRWTSAPQTVRGAIVQELTDITTLLQSETPFEAFVFSNHDLDAHLDDLYSAYDKEQVAAKEIADKEAALKAEAKLQRLAEEQLEQQQNEEKSALLADQNIDETLDNETIISAKSDSSLTDTNVTTSHENINKIDKTAGDKTKASIDLSSQDIKLSAANLQMIEELEVHIDDYLMEQMTQLSENLKSWLRAEVTRQLSEK